jgi:hypothetical protein
MGKLGPSLRGACHARKRRKGDAEHRLRRLAKKKAPTAAGSGAVVEIRGFFSSLLAPEIGLPSRSWKNHNAISIR